MALLWRVALHRLSLKTLKPCLREAVGGTELDGDAVASFADLLHSL
jgi:hypothetical protein